MIDCTDLEGVGGRVWAEEDDHAVNDLCRSNYGAHNLREKT